MTDTEPTIEGMVDDFGRPATIYTPPELLRRDPNRWPTSAEFVAEWEQHTPERRLQLAERILASGQEAATCFELDHAGHIAHLTRALDAERAAREAAEAEVERLREARDSWRNIAHQHYDSWQACDARAEAAEAKVARVEALADHWQTVGDPSCVCGHDLGRHNGLGCYARVSYSPLIVCSCTLTDDRTHGLIAAEELRRTLADPDPADPTEPAEPEVCPNHRPVQHRDARPPWCNTCGLTAGGLKPVGRLDLAAEADSQGREGER